MQIKRCATLFIGLAIGLSAVAVHTGDVLKMEVTPAIQREPAIVTVRATIEASPDNRMLEVTAKSAELARTSKLPVDGAKDAAQQKVVEFRDLPSGLYQITGVLIGSQGPRATVVRLAKIEPGPGSR
jgi:hypothetical protein